eukprot:GFKZ01012554.1.p1 GENE.GFKZ01012554.1~~GFKZ01012554.1.p1  ORF type:complete len:602 (+),score=76.33 GFKZ01012554.1:74-1807(+)
MSLLRRPRLPLFAGTLLVTTAASVSLERHPGLLDHTPLESPASSIIALVRFARALGTASVVMADYRLLFARHLDYTTEHYREERSMVHRRSASRLLALARRQGAVYVKIGQHVASMNHAVPPEYSQRLRLLEDRAAYRPYRQIRRALAMELGRGVMDVFEDFDRVPVAAASLAQVHRAKLQGGDEVAVKVQYPGLEALVEGDLKSIKMLSWMLSWVFPYFNMAWVVDQFRKNLEKEIDFELEAESAERTAEFFTGDDKVWVPAVYRELSTKRLLVMEYVDGFRVDDVEEMAQGGIDPHQVAETVVNAFAQMIFVNGFVHCDPHAGNLMVRRKEGGHFDLFLLDHGLYRQLDDSFRQSYCKLWRGLVLRKDGDVEKACKELGAPGFANVFSMFLLNRSWRFAKKLGTDIRVKMSKEELKQLRNDLKEGGLRSQADVSAFVERIPDDLLLVFKMNSLVRNVNKALGASVNRFKVNARYAVKGLRHFNGYGDTTKGQSSGGALGAVVLAGTHSELTRTYDRFLAMGNWIRTVMDCAYVELHLFCLDVALLAVKWWFGGNFVLDPGANKGATDSEAIGLIG